MNHELKDSLSASLRKPSRQTLTLIEKALAWLRPFESPAAKAASSAERSDLLDLLRTHRLILSPYLDIDRIESNLRRIQ